MATTETFAMGDGTTTEFGFPFPYIKTEDVKVELQEYDATQTAGNQIISRQTITAFIVPSNNPTVVQFSSIGTATNYQAANGAPLANHAVSGLAIRVRIYRFTDADSIPATFIQGSAIRAQDLNDNFEQNLYIMQERQNTIVSIQTGGIGENVISTNALQDDSVDASKLRDSVSDDTQRAVTTNHIRDNAVTSAKIANVDSNLVTFDQSVAGSVSRTVESKLKDVISVKDFGAVGDGVTDDTAAIQAAIDSAGSNSVIQFGSETYLISSAIKIDGTLRNLSGVNLVGTATLKLASNVQRQNIIESISGKNHTIKGLRLEHNADRGGFFSRHAPTPGLTANSGATLKTTANSGDTTVSIQATTLTGKLGPGDTISFTGDATIYTVTNTTTASSNELLGITITPALAGTIVAGTALGVYQHPRYKTKTGYSSGSSVITLDALSIQNNSSPFPAVALRVGEQFQFLKRTVGSLNSYSVDPAHTTVYTVQSEVPVSSGGIGKEFVNVTISPALTQAVSANTFITSIQDANNRYSCGIYLANSDSVTVEDVEVDQAVWHGILIGTGPRTAPGYTPGGTGANINGCRISNFGGNGIAGGDQPNMVIIGNRVLNNTSNVGHGIFPDSGCDNCIISSNVISDVVSGVYSFSNDYLIVEGNTISGSIMGMTIDSTSNTCTIDGNVITGDSDSTAGIYIRKGDLVNNYAFSAMVVSSNVIRGIANGAGITLRNAGAAITTTPLDDNVFITISDNIISESYTYGIELISTIRSLVSGNNVTYSNSHGISIKDCKVVSLKDNTISNWGLTANAAGIYLINSDEISLDGNYAAKIQFTSANTQYGLQVDTGVTNLRAGRNYFKGDTAQTNIDLANIDTTLSVTALLDYPSIPSKAAADLTVAVTGARPLDIVRVSPPAVGIGLCMFNAFVSSNDVVTVRAFNPALSAVDLAPATFRIQVDKYSV